MKGVIFDSSPGERRITALFKAISAILGGHPLTNFPFSIIITMFLSIFWLYEVQYLYHAKFKEFINILFIKQIISRAWGKGDTIQTNPIALMEEPHSWPQLFLYSNADTLIPAMVIEKFIIKKYTLENMEPQSVILSSIVITFHDDR